MKRCRYCGKAMNDSDLFCPRCAREYREDKYMVKEDVDSIITNHNSESHSIKKTRANRKAIDIPNIKLGKKAPLFVLGLILIVAIPPIASLLLMILAISLANKVKRDQS